MSPDSSNSEASASLFTCSAEIRNMIYREALRTNRIRECVPIIRDHRSPAGQDRGVNLMLTNRQLYNETSAFVRDNHSTLGLWMTDSRGTEHDFEHLQREVDVFPSTIGPDNASRITRLEIGYRDLFPEIPSLFARSPTANEASTRNTAMFQAIPLYRNRGGNPETNLEIFLGLVGDLAPLVPNVQTLVIHDDYVHLFMSPTVVVEGLRVLFPNLEEVFVVKIQVRLVLQRFEVGRGGVGVKQVADGEEFLRLIGREKGDGEVEEWLRKWE